MTVSFVIAIKTSEMNSKTFLFINYVFSAQFPTTLTSITTGTFFKYTCPASLDQRICEIMGH